MSYDSDSSNNTRWDGFSDYKRVSDRVAQSCERAVRAYSFLDSRHQEDASVKPEDAAEVRSQILTPALRLLPEMQRDAENVEMYEEMLERWQGSDDDDDDDGYITKINECQLQKTCPGWLLNFVIDIRRAAFELGYLQAGRTVKQDPDDPVEAETDGMFDDL